MSFYCEHVECPGGGPWVRSQGRSKHYQHYHPKESPCTVPCTKCESNVDKELKRMQREGELKRNQDRDSKRVRLFMDLDTGEKVEEKEIQVGDNVKMVDTNPLVLCRHVVCQPTMADRLAGYDKRRIVSSSRSTHEKTDHPMCHDRCYVCMGI